MKGIGASAAEPGAPALEAGRGGLGGWPAARRPLPSPLQARELSPCLRLEEAPGMRLGPSPSPGFRFSPRSEPEAPKLLVRAALLLCDGSEEKGRLCAAAASVRLRRAGDAPGFMCL